MFKWIFNVIGAIFFSVICYITNPIAALFANEVGEIKGFFKLWQTWDDSCDVDFMVKEVVPSIFRYDFDSKYENAVEYPPELTAVGRYKYCVKLKPGATFSTKEKIQRYFCRVLWLTRNCAYGFAFWWFGNNIIGTDMERKIYEEDKIFLLEKGKNIFNGYWSYKDESFITTIAGYNIFWKNYLGWKIDENNPYIRRCMIANRIALKIRKKENRL